MAAVPHDDDHPSGATVSLAEPLSGLDAAFLALDTTRTPMHMGAVGVFAPERPVDARRLAALVAARARGIDRLRLRVDPGVFPLDAPVWRPDPRFDVDRHVRVHALPSGSDAGTLIKVASDWIAQPLPQSRALWSVDIVTGLPGGEFALLLKLHHALTDGTGAVEVAAALLDDVGLRSLLDRAAATGAEPAEAPERGGHGGVASWARTALGLAPAAVRTARKAVDGITAQAEVGYDVARAVRPRHASPLAAVNSDQRRLAFVRLDTADVRQIRKMHGGTPNDVVLAVLAGALRTWLQNRGLEPDEVTLRALIPVSLRGREVARAGGNRLSGYLCDLPVDEPDPIMRLAHVRACMDRNKASGPLRGAGAIPVLANRIPTQVHRLTTGLIGGAGSVLFDTVVTTVPLPSVPLALDGAPLRASMPVIPLAPGQALGVAVSPYRDAIHIGLHADGRALPDVDVLADAVEKEAARLHELCQ